MFITNRLIPTQLCAFHPLTAFITPGVSFRYKSNKTDLFHFEHVHLPTFCFSWAGWIGLRYHHTTCFNLPYKWSINVTGVGCTKSDVVIAKEWLSKKITYGTRVCVIQLDRQMVRISTKTPLVELPVGATGTHQQHPVDQQGITSNRSMLITSHLTTMPVKLCHFGQSGLKLQNPMFCQKTKSVWWLLVWLWIGNEQPGIIWFTRMCSLAWQNNHHRFIG